MEYKNKMNEDIFLTTKNAIHQQWMNIPELVNFTPWPTDMTLKEIKPNHIPASTILQKWITGLNPQTKRLHECICTLAPHVNWQQTYFEEELGRDFLNRYGFFEFLGQLGISIPFRHVHVSHIGTVNFITHGISTKQKNYILSSLAKQDSS